MYLQPQVRASPILAARQPPVPRQPVWSLLLPGFRSRSQVKFAPMWRGLQDAGTGVPKAPATGALSESRLGGTPHPGSVIP